MKRNRLALLAALFFGSGVSLLGGTAQTTFSRAPTWVYEFFTIDAPGAPYTSLQGINNRNEIVGYGAPNVGPTQGYVWANGALTPLTAPGTGSTWPTDVNDNGTIVGFCECSITGGAGQHGFRYAGGTFTIAPFEQPFSVRGRSTGINNPGRVVGWFDDQSRAPDGGTLTRRYSYLDAEWFPNIELEGINDAGNAVGRSYFNGLAAFYHAGTTTTAITLPFRPDAVPDPKDINNANTVVGSYAHQSWPSPDALRGFVWSNGKAVSINYPGAFTTSINGINDAGIIVGNYGPDVFSSHGFVAVPRSPVTVTVNGVAGPATIDRAQSLRVDVTFVAPAEGPLSPAELYVGVVSPYGIFWVDASGRLVSTPTRTFAGSLAGFGPSPAIQLPSASAWPPATYTWFAIVDDDTNGVPNGAFYDLAQVTIR